MLNDFRKIYNQELNKQLSNNGIEAIVLSSTEIRMFVYEVCKACMQPTEDRLKKKKAHLKILKFAFKTLSIYDSSWTHLEGRIREIKDEIDFLEGI